MDGTTVEPLQTTLSVDPVLDALPDALADALADVIADVRREARREAERDLELHRAETRATIAELRAELGEMKAQIQAAHVADRAKVAEVLSTIKSGEPGLPGRDADPALVAELVDAAIAKQPAPLTIEDVRNELGAVVKSLPVSVTREDVVPMLRELVVAEVAAHPAAPGEPGKDADLTQVRAFIIEELEAAYKAIPIPKDGHTPTEEELTPLIEKAALGLIDVLPVPKDGAPGRDGIDGKDAEPLTAEAVEAAVLAHPEAIAAAVASHLEANPPAAGEKGDPGQNGVDGKDAVAPTTEEVAEILRPALADEVARYLEANPPPAGRDGESIQGEPGPPGEPGRDGKDADPDQVRAFIHDAVKALPAPQDGHTPTLEELAPLVKEAVSEGLAALPQPVHLKRLLIDRAGSLVATMSDGSTDEVGPVVGKDGDPGKDASLPDVAAMIEAEFAKVQADVSAGREPPIAPEDLAQKVGKAIYLLNESPPIEHFKAWPAQEGQGNKSMAITRDPKGGLRVQTITE